MNLEELIKNYDVKVVLLKDKRRITKKGDYGFFDPNGNVMVPRKTRKKYRDIYTDIGIICQYIDDLGYYLCCLDVDTKDFPLTRLLSEYPSSIVETRHGYHIYYLSTDPIRLKQLIGKEKEICPVDLRGQRDPRQCKEGSYTKMYGESSGNLNIVNFNDVIKYTYSLFGIEAKPIGEYDANVKAAELIKQNNNTKSNVELFLAYYLFYQKGSWKSAYDVAFPFGLQLAGWLDKASMQRVAYKIMSISEYYAPRKWIQSFLTGYENGEKRRPYFGHDSLKREFAKVFTEKFDELNEEEIESLAKYCKDNRLYEILELII